MKFHFKQKTNMLSVKLVAWNFSVFYMFLIKFVDVSPAEDLLSVFLMYLLLANV